MAKTEITTIRVAKKTRDRLARHGEFGQTIDDVVNRVLDTVEEQHWISKRHAGAADVSDRRAQGKKLVGRLVISRCRQTQNVKGSSLWD